MKRLFELNEADILEMNKFIYTCHKCGTTFSPVHIVLLATNHCDYYLGHYARLFYVIKVEGVCSCNQPIGIYLYDEPRNFFHTATKDEIEKWKKNQKKEKEAMSHAIEIHNERVKNADQTKKEST